MFIYIATTSQLTAYKKCPAHKSESIKMILYIKHFELPEEYSISDTPAKTCTNYKSTRNRHSSFPANEQKRSIIKRRSALFPRSRDGLIGTPSDLLPACLTARASADEAPVRDTLFLGRCPLVRRANYRPIPLGAAIVLRLFFAPAAPIRGSPCNMPLFARGQCFRGTSPLHR